MEIILSFIALLVSITVHEFMHAWTADYLGDPTPRSAGRVTLNPIAHIDPIGTIMVPLFLNLLGVTPFGWAKPVPINPNNFKNYRYGEILTSLAGPMANFAMVLGFAMVYKALPIKESIFSAFIIQIIIINLVLMIFNLIPIPPLDGSKVIYSFLPYRVVETIERYGIFLIIPVVFIFGRLIIVPVANFILNLIGIPLNLF